MYRNTLSSISSLFAGTALALILTGCSPPRIEAKTVRGTFATSAPDGSDAAIVEDRDTFSTEGGKTLTTATKPSLYERCLANRRGQDRDKTYVACDDLMNNIDADRGIPPYYYGYGAWWPTLY